MIGGEGLSHILSSLEVDEQVSSVRTNLYLDGMSSV